MTPLEHALHYAQRGWRVAPIRPGTKHPRIDQWQVKATTDPTIIATWWERFPTDGVSTVTGERSGLVVVDVDPAHGGDDTLAELEAAHGPLPETVEALTGGGGRHLYFHMPDGAPYPRNDQAGIALGPGLDIRGDGGQVVAPPTVHPNGRPYSWELEHDPLDGHAPVEAPAWLVQLLEPKPVEPRRERIAPTAIRIGDPAPGEVWADEHCWADVLGADGWQLHSARPGADGAAYELWVRPGKELRAGPSASLYYGGYDLLKVFTTNPPAGLECGQTYSLWGYHVATRHGGDFEAAARSVRHELNARAAAAAVPGGVAPPPPGPPGEPTPAPDTESAPISQPYTDLGNARLLVATHGADLRYAPEFGSWLAWDGHRWAEDVTGEVHRRAKGVVDSFITQLAQIEGEEARKKLFGHWMRSQTASRLDAMIHVARTEPGIPVRVRELDADPWILNTRSGVLDLRTGEIHGHDRRQLVTKLAPVDVDPAAACPTWEWFVDWAMCGDRELVEFLQRAVGYSITGSTAEQCLLFCHGPGANGKSTFLAVLARMLDDYAGETEPDLLLASNSDRHTTGLTDLMGKRLAVAQETDEGRTLAEALVKKLTGDQTVTARRMRQDNFTFTATHKLWMAANHRPNVRGTDHAIWRRIHLIPWMAHLEPGQRDDHLVDKLTAELPGILNWAIAGCLAWQRDGLQPPTAVVAATAEYRSEQDHIGRFIDDCCTLAPGLTITARDLRETYEKWCTENGERAWSAKAMAPKLVERGCHADRGDRGASRIWRGLALAGDAQRELSQRLDAGDWGARAAGETGREVSNASSDDAMTHRDALSGSPYAHAHDPGNGRSDVNPSSRVITGETTLFEEPYDPANEPF